jgi:2-oxoglutarate dehydrogenase E2 component (dihydrolipoamide succinyltransferase)
VEQLFAKDDLVPVGQTIAIIETEGVRVAVVKQLQVKRRCRSNKTVDAAKDSVATQLISRFDKFLSFSENIAQQRGYLLLNKSMVQERW